MRQYDEYLTLKSYDYWYLKNSQINVNKFYNFDLIAKYVYYQIQIFVPPTNSISEKDCLFEIKNHPDIFTALLIFIA